ncbi:MAG: tripartite tricarboxylate transporter substrate binding protein [Rhizobacter sp.]|nr:tripartite tricarboxylate transporter substrate binding protein [Burkholderiales bacterium]
MKQLFKRSAALAFTVTLVHSFAFAQTAWPDKPVKLIVPYAPGGTTDFAARQIAQKLTEQTGKSFFVENKVGASGLIGTDAVAKSPPDGTTFQINDTTYAMLPHLFKKLPWDHDKDMIAVTSIAQTPLVLVVSEKSPYKTMQDLVAFGKKNPGKLNYGSGGVGSSSHLGGELFKDAAKIDATHVPFKGAGEAMLNVVSGSVDFLVTAAPTAIPQVNGGKIRALAVTSPARIATLGNVPTTAEVGLKDFNATNWFGLAAPKGTPQPVIDKLYAEVKKALASPDLAKRFADQGAEPGGAAPAEFQLFVRAETERWGKVIRVAGVKPE